MSASLSNPNATGLTPGTVIGGRYRIDGVLGAGGMGVVLLATHLELDSPVAIKVVRDDLARDPRVVSRLIFEARAAARLRGTHIVRVLDVARLDSGAPYIVMERLEGSDLQGTLAERGALSVHEAVSYLLQACEGLAEAHGLGIIHRDLKPENLFLATTPEGVVLKILDFGISKDTGTARRSANRSTLTKAGMAVGSPYYMSPEQMRASPGLDARSDIWSLGAILFELLTNQCPFEAASPAALCTKVMCEPAPSLRAFASHAPAELDDIVRRCLQKDPSARFQTVSELSDALRAFTAADELTFSDSPRLASGVSRRPDSAPPALADLAASESNELLASEAYELATIQANEHAAARTKTTRQLLAVCALLAVAGVAFWQLLGHPDSRPWSSLTSLVERPALTRSAQPSPARAAEPTPSPVPSAESAPTKTLAPARRAAPAATRAPAYARVAPPSTANAAPTPAPARAPAQPKPESPPPADPDSLATRYGL